MLGDVDEPYKFITDLDINLEEFEVVFPYNSNLIPPGYYMLFLVSALSPNPMDLRYPLMGSPSIAQIIKIELETISPPINDDIIINTLR